MMLHSTTKAHSKTMAASGTTIHDGLLAVSAKHLAPIIGKSERWIKGHTDLLPGVKGETSRSGHYYIVARCVAVMNSRQ